MQHPTTHRSQIITNKTQNPYRYYSLCIHSKKMELVLFNQLSVRRMTYYPDAQTFYLNRKQVTGVGAQIFFKVIHRIKQDVDAHQADVFEC